MREQYKSIITADGWILCAKCGHKLARIYNIPQTFKTCGKEQIKSPTIEFKCTSCKTKNVWEVKND